MIIIPARLESTRLHQKALQYIGGYPMVVRAAMAVKDAGYDTPVVATDSEYISKICDSYDIFSIKTGEAASGTDRVWEAVQALSLPDDKVVVNVSGDYPFVDGEDLRQLLTSELVHQGAIGTLVKPIDCEDVANSPDIVKVAMDQYNDTVYMSRAPIPHKGKRYEHVGIYSFRVDTLRKLCSLRPGLLERSEGIEGLRAVEGKIPMHAFVSEFDYIGVNTEDDLKEAQRRAVV